MTDNEIIKALECCADEYIHSCDYCPFEKECNGDNLNLVKYALDLINRQKAQIKDLKKDINHYKINLPYLEHQSEDFCGVPCSFMENLVEKAKAKAIKEFAKRLKSDMSYSYLLGREFCTDVTIDNLVKEMVGEG